MDPILKTKCQTCSGGCATDRDADFRIAEEFRRFSQKDVIFSRSWWDSSVRSAETDRFYESYRRPLKEWRHVDGYDQKDFALRNAGWHVADFFAERLEADNRREGFLDYLTAHRGGASERRPVDDPEEMAREIKKVAKLFGADLVGITYYDERWVYSHRYSRATEDEVPMDLPRDLTSVVVVCHEMDHDLLRTVPSALSGTATGVGYSEDVVTLLALAQYIRNLGYRAFASMNAIAKAKPSNEVYNQSNIRGVEKWTTDAEKCFGFWATQMTDCSICVRVCPYNRDYPGWLNRIRVRLMGSFLRRLMLKLDELLADGERQAPRWWWS